MDWRAFTDTDFWKGVGRNLRSLPEDALKLAQDLQEIPGRASDIADTTYPGSARDASTKNAFRHALGTGMVAQRLGGNAPAALAAKMAGWGWELPTLLDPRSTEAQRMDSKHDLNANAIGALAAQRTSNQADLVNALKTYADQSEIRLPPDAFASTPGYLTRTVR